MNSYALSALIAIGGGLISAGDIKSPEYLKLNPMGKVPALTHKGTVITEVAAICAYLAGQFPESGLAPALMEKSA